MSMSARQLGLLAVLGIACGPQGISRTDAPTVPTADTGREVTDAFAMVRTELVPGIETVIRVVWNQPAAGTSYVQFRTDPKAAWQSSPPKQRERSTASEVILGVPYETDVEYQVVADLGEGEQILGPMTFRTGDWPDTLPVPIVLKNDPGAWEPTAPYMITSMNREGDGRRGRWWVFIMDRAGQIVWAQETPRQWISRHVSVAHDGHSLLVDRDTFWTDAISEGSTSEVVDMTLDGQIHHTYAVPGLHHSFVPLPEGVIAWGAKNETDWESLEKVDLDGTQTRIWHCRDLHQEVGTLNFGCGSNGLFWDPTTDHFLFSFWSTDTVVEIDHATGSHLRWFGDLPGSYVFDPPASQFWWQHGPTYTPQGTFMVSTKDREGGAETLIREYEVDHEKKVLHQIWSFGEKRGIYGEYMGEAHRLPNGNTLHVYGAGGHLAEAMPDGTVAWEVTWTGDKHNGRTTPWQDLYELVD